MREQTIVVRSTLKSVNQTLQDVSTNELTLMKELQEILNFVNGNKKIESKYAFTALSLALNDHATRIRQAIDAVRDVYDVYYKCAYNGGMESYNHRCYHQAV